MILIKILVENLEQAEEINDLLVSAEETEAISYPFGVRFTEDLSPSVAERNFYEEN